MLRASPAGYCIRGGGRISAGEAPPPAAWRVRLTGRRSRWPASSAPRVAFAAEQLLQPLERLAGRHGAGVTTSWRGDSVASSAIAVATCSPSPARRNRGPLRWTRALDIAEHQHREAPTVGSR
jgi:hypothetical protein